MVSREEFDALRSNVDALRKRVEQLHPTVDEHGERIADHARQLDEVRRELRALSSSVGRLADLITPVTLSLPRVEKNVARLVEILEPRKVIVDGSPA